MTEPARLVFHRNAFFELQLKGRTFFIDPVFSQERRRRRVAGDVRTADYVLLTTQTPWYDDALDVLEACEATLVATPSLCRQVLDDLGVDRKRLLDLEPWERASEEGIKVTALPLTASTGMEATIEEGASILEDVAGVFPTGLRSLPLVGTGVGLLENGMRTGRRAVKDVAGMGRNRMLGRAQDLLGMNLGRLGQGRPGTGFLVEADGYPSLLHLADGIHRGTSEDELRDIAEVAKPDVLLANIDGPSVQPLVRAIRILAPRTLLVYRSRDPYGEDRRNPTPPARAFMDAVAEDAPDCEVVLLRKGDAWVLEPLATEAP